MILLLMIVLVVCLVAGGFGVIVHGLFWLFWVALIVFVIALVWGLVTRSFSQRGSGGPPVV